MNFSLERIHVEELSANDEAKRNQFAGSCKVKDMKLIAGKVRASNKDLVRARAFSSGTKSPVFYFPGS